MGTQAIIANDRSLVVGATLTASAQRASTDIRPLSQAQQGGGSLTLTGPFTGPADSTVEVQVLEGTGAALRTSRPVLAGVGSGTLEVLTLDAAAIPERITVRLVDAGAPARAALLPFFGVTLQAKEAGAAGNALTLEVERRLTLEPTQYSVLTEIPAGEGEHEGAQWDWGAPVGADGQIPREAPRLAFAGHAQVLRHWREWDEGRWLLRLDPAPAAWVAAGTRILEVSGDYRLTLADGVTSEVYTAVSVYDFLRQLAARSALVEVLGPVAEDRAPGGMAATDIPLRTDAYHLPVQAQISGPYGAARLDAISVQPEAPTELLTITRATTGRWSVTGSVSGDLPAAKTGIPYQPGASPAAFTIPAVTIPPEGVPAIVATPRYVSPRPDDAGTPTLCIEARAGAAATPQTLTFIYTARPPAECSCAGVSAPRVSDGCLGFGAEGDSMDYPRAVRQRIAKVYAWREAFARGNTYWQPTTPAWEEEVGGAEGVPGRYRLRAIGHVYWRAAGSEWYTSLSATAVSTYSDKDAALSAVAAINGSYDYVSGNPVTLGGQSFTVAYYTPGYPGPGATDLWCSWEASLVTLREPTPPVEGTTIQHPMELAGWRGATLELAAMDRLVEILLPTLVQVHEDEDALAGWDALWAEARAEHNARLNVSNRDDLRALGEAWWRRYETACDNLRISAGIYPTFEPPSTEAGACWADDPDATHWWVESTGTYLPAFTGRPYYSARRVAGCITPTHEFGFGLAVACSQRLVEGDAIQLVIQGATSDGYLPGDLFRLPLVAAAPAPFSGGAEPQGVHTWTVRGAASGALPDWAWDPLAPADYASAVLGLRLTPGGIPFQVGDAWGLEIEGGRLRWRRDAGAWSEADLFAAPDLGDGLSLAALAGEAPSFARGDSWTWRALALHAPERLRAPIEGQAWAWDEATATLDLDLGAVVPIAALLIAQHRLPAGAAITWSGGDLAVGEWLLEPERREVRLHLVDQGAHRLGELARQGLIPAGAVLQDQLLLAVDPHRHPARLGDRQRHPDQGVVAVIRRGHRRGDVPRRQCRGGR